MYLLMFHFIYNTYTQFAVKNIQANTNHNYDREESIKCRHTVHQMYAESNVTFCTCHN